MYSVAAFCRRGICVILEQAQGEVNVQAGGCLLAATRPRLCEFGACNSSCFV